MDDGEFAEHFAEMVGLACPHIEISGLDIGEVQVTTADGQKFRLTVERVESFD